MPPPVPADQYLYFRWSRDLCRIKVSVNEYGLLFKKAGEGDGIFINEQGYCYVMTLGRLVDGERTHLVFYGHYLEHATFRQHEDAQFESLGANTPKYDNTNGWRSNPFQIWRSSTTEENYQEEVIRGYFDG